MSIKALLWDIGGVLLRTADRTPRTHLAERLGLSYSELENLVFNSEMGRKAQLGQASTSELWEWVANALQQPPDSIPQLRRTFFGGDVLDTDLVDYIRRMHGPYRTAILSNNLDNARRLVNETWQMGDAFDHLTISAEVGVMKPEARIYHLTLEALGVQPGEAVFVDDFAHNVQGAQAVGMHAVHFRTPQQAIEDLEAILASQG
jgi:epoxide hydrolase-like predicted phosphatase